MDLNAATSQASAILALLIPIGAWVAIWLTRKGKAEDNKRAEDGQVFQQVLDLAELRGGEIIRLGAALVAQRTEFIDKLDQQRKEFAAQLDRQSFRCHKVTNILVDALDSTRTHPATAALVAEQALKELEDHRDEDHEDPDAPKGHGEQS